MSTRSNIAILNNDGSVNYVYCHFDGYLSHVGKLLLENYNTEEKVRDLINHGDMSFLTKTVETSKFYSRDCGEVIHVNHSTIDQLLRNGNDYNYLFNPETQNWSYSRWHDSNFKSFTLEDCERD